jgi:hypothetical protein
VLLRELEIEEKKKEAGQTNAWWQNTRKEQIWHAILSSKYAIISSCKIFSCTRFQVIEISFLMFLGILVYWGTPKKKTKRKKAKKKGVVGERNSGKTKVCSICGFKSLKMDFWAEEFLGGFFQGCRRWVVGWWEFDMGKFYQAAYLHACRLRFEVYI